VPAPAPLVLPAPEDSELAPPPAASLLDEPAEAAVDEVLVDVEEVRTPAAFSALVSVGGVISGVVLGTASATLLPPHPLTATAQSNAAEAASAARAVHALERGRCRMGDTS
jgi:hypothetical protein